MEKLPENPVSYRGYFGIVLVSLYLLTCSVHINALKKPVLSDDESEQFAEKTTHFAIDLLRAVNESRPSRNVVLSSFSVQTCLGVIELGADNETSAVLQPLLPSHSVFSKVLDIYTNKNIPTIASQFFFSPASYVLESFNYPIAQYFRFTSQEINIGHNPDVDMWLHRWFEREGMSRTRTIFIVNAGEKRRLLFANLMNFKNEWLYKFSKAHTQLEDFYMTTAERIKVPMMNQGGFFLYASIPKLNASAVTLHYKDNNMSMLVLLPDLDTNLYQLQGAVTYEAIKEIRSLQCYKYVQVKFPKFNGTSLVRFKEPLTKLGLEGVFSTTMRIFEDPEILNVHRMVQRNYFVVTEEGTNRNGRATQVHYKLSSPPKTFEFYANRPFLFFIQNEAGHIFYAGSISKFTKSVILTN